MSHLLLEVSASELLASDIDRAAFTVSDKHRGLGWAYYELAIFTLVNVDLGRIVKDRSLAVFQETDVKGPAFDLTRYFHHLLALLLREHEVRPI